MTLKLIDAKDIKTGNAIIIDENPYTVSKVDTSTTGRHGHKKVRIEAEGILNNRKKVMVVPGHERMKIPEVIKGKAQVLSVNKNVANIMDTENYKTIDVDISEEMKDKIDEGDNVEYWDAEGEKIIKRKL